MMDVMQEFDYQIGTFHHAVEAYKIADKLKENDVCSAMWADWWGFKMEAYDGIRENIPAVHAAGARAKQPSLHWPKTFARKWNLPSPCDRQ